MSEIFRCSASTPSLFLTNIVFSIYLPLFLHFMTTLKSFFLILLSIITVKLALASTLGTIEEWAFSDPDGTETTSSMSNLGNSFSNKVFGSLNISGESLQFGYDGETEKIFSVNQFTGPVPSSGIVEMSWTFSSIDFSRTALASGIANVGFDFRDQAGTPWMLKDDTLLAGVRLSHRMGQTRVQVQTSNVPKYATIKSYPYAVFAEELKVRVRFDFDQAGTVGSLQVILQLGELEEEFVVDDGTLPIGANLTGYRINQQTRNGKTNWALGDVVTINEFKLSASN